MLLFWRGKKCLWEKWNLRWMQQGKRRWAPRVTKATGCDVGEVVWDGYIWIKKRKGGVTSYLNGCYAHLFFAFHLSIAPRQAPPLEGVGLEQRLSLSQRPPAWINLQCFTFLIPVPLSSVPLSFHSLKIRRSYLACFRTGLYVITELLPLCEEHQGDGGP